AAGCCANAPGAIRPCRAAVVPELPGSLINAFATNRKQANMSPPTPMPYITEAGTQSFFALGCAARPPPGTHLAEGRLNLHFLDNGLLFLDNHSGGASAISGKRRVKSLPGRL